MKRRQFIITLPALATARSLLAAAGAEKSRLGICTFSCHQRWKFKNPLDAAGFYRYPRELSAEGVQSPLRGCEPKTIRDLVEQTGGYYEGDMQALFITASTGLYAVRMGVKGTAQ